MKVVGPLSCPEASRCAYHHGCRDDLWIHLQQKCQTQSPSSGLCLDSFVMLDTPQIIKIGP